MLDAEVLRGRRRRSPSIASDAGGGVRKVFVVVNGRDRRHRSRNLRRQPAASPLRSAPAPARRPASFALRDRHPGLRQGRTTWSRACASDSRPRQRRQPRAASRHDLRSTTSARSRRRGGTALSAGFAGGRSRTARSGAIERAQVSGRLTDSDGRPVAGAAICLASAPGGDRAAPSGVVATADHRRRRPLPRPAAARPEPRDLRRLLAGDSSARARAAPRARLAPRRA